MGQNIINTRMQRNWWARRNHLVCKLMAENTALSGREALGIANRMMKPTKTRKRRRR